MKHTHLFTHESGKIQTHSITIQNLQYILINANSINVLPGKLLVASYVPGLNQWVRGEKRTLPVNIHKSD